jgi:hypothetical protein
MNRNALVLAILTEVTLFATLLVSLEHCHALKILLRVVHAPASGLYIGLTDWLSLSPSLDYWLSSVFVFCAQTAFWCVLFCRVSKVSDEKGVVQGTSPNRC